MNKIAVLDKGYVALIEHSGSDELITSTARISTGSQQEEVEPLIRNLARWGHTTPFEFCHAVFEVKAPLFVFRQWHRHRTQTFLERSGRYTSSFGEYYIPARASKEGQEKISSTTEAALRAYKELLEAGEEKELARLVLPLNMYSTMRAAANLWNWIRFLRLRLLPSAQFEIRQYAEAIEGLLREKFPLAIAYMIEEWKIESSQH